MIQCRPIDNNGRQMSLDLKSTLNRMRLVTDAIASVRNISSDVLVIATRGHVQVRIKSHNCGV